MEKKRKIPKEKRRNMERRKEKSRDAARCRRGKETEIFTDLSSMLPLSKNDSVSHLDKASIIRIAISYLKIRTIIQSMPLTLNENMTNENVYDTDSLFLNALEGFLLIINIDGDIVFISENVNRYLGLAQVDLLGQSLYEISHPCDHSEIKEMLSTKDASAKSYFFRMKCTLTNKGRNVNIKSASYKVIHFSGRPVVAKSMKAEIDYSKQKSSSSEDESSDSFSVEELPDILAEKKPVEVSSLYFVALGEPILHPANIEIPLGRNIFLTKHSLDMKFTYADENLIELFGYEPKSLIDKSVFDYQHAEDSNCLRNYFKSLFQKGQCQTESYRFLAFGGGYAWVLTQATVIYGSTQKPESVVCVNFVISGVENKGEIYSLCQIKEDISNCVTNCVGIGENNAKEDVAADVRVENSPQHLMEKLCIDTSSRSDRVSEKLVESMFSTDPPAYSDAVTDCAKNVAKEMSDAKDEEEDVLDEIPLCVGDFFLVPPISNTVPQSANNENWLLADQDNTTLADFISKNYTTPQAKKEIYRGNSERVFSTAKIFSSTKAPEPATTNVFVPFTEDMNKGFLGFAADNEFTILKDDAEDLTHLAPTAGDVCVPLDNSPMEYVLPDFFDEIILPDENNEHYLDTSQNSFFSYKDALTSPSQVPPQDDSFNCKTSSLSPNLVKDFLDFENLIQSPGGMEDMPPKNDIISLPLDADTILPFMSNDFVWDSSSEESSWSSHNDSQSSSSSSIHLEDDCNLTSKLLTINKSGIYDDTVTEAAHGRKSINEQFTFGTGTIRNRTSSMSGNDVININGPYATNNQANRGMGYNNFSGITMTNTKSAPVANTKISAIDIKNRNEDNRLRDVTTGTKRSSSESWDHSSLCKRSKPTTKISDLNLMNGWRIADDKIQNSSILAAIESTECSNQTNNVLMNLLVGGCDSSAAYDKSGTNESYETTAEDMRIIEEALRTDNFKNMNAATWTRVRRKILDILGLNGSEISSISPVTNRNNCGYASNISQELQNSKLFTPLNHA